MKKIGKNVETLAVVCIIAFCMPPLTFQALAIEGLKISVQSTNAVLSWPSDSSETYIVQYRNTLDATDSWQTLVDLYPAFSGTNQTTFVHSNQVSFAANIAESSSGNSFAAGAALMQMQSLPPVPLAIPAGGTGAGIPVSVYPPGFDLSGFTIFDPITGETVSGADYAASSSSQRALMSRDVPQPSDGPQPNGSGSGSSLAPTTGFYRVVRDGAHLFGITNGMTLSGVMTVPVEVANGSGTLVNLGLTENDASVYGVTSQTSPFSSPLKLRVDTTQMSNGVHQISASATWQDTNGGIWEAESPPVTVNIYNEITFPNWMPRFGELGNSLSIAVQSAHQDADWWIDVYDSQYVWLGTFSGHTYDGNIHGYWNLVGRDGQLHGDSTFHFVVTTEWTSSLAQQGGDASNAFGTASAVAPPLWKAIDPWSGSGGWVCVAQHAFDNLIDHKLVYAELLGFVGAAQNVGWPVSPQPYTDDDGNLVPYAINFQNTSESGDWTAFRNALYAPSSRNLAYFGHGGPNNLGFNWSDTNASISAKEIAGRLHTFPDNQTNRHAFRFVFLDGCSTANGSFPEAFGIIHKPITDISYYSDAAIRPSAFVGWTGDKWVSNAIGISIYLPHVNFISHIQTQMLLGWGLKESIDYAASAPDVYWSFLWANQFKVFGFEGLHFGQYNN